MRYAILPDVSSAAKRSAGAAPEVHLRNLLRIGDEVCQGIDRGIRGSMKRTYVIQKSSRCDASGSGSLSYFESWRV